MTAGQLRKHLAQRHGVFLWGADWDHLVRRHDQAHIDHADHAHDEVPAGDG